MPTSILQSLSFAHPVLNGDIYFGNALPYAWHTLKWVFFWWQYCMFIYQTKGLVTLYAPLFFVWLFYEKNSWHLSHSLTSSLMQYYCKTITKDHTGPCTVHEKWNCMEIIDFHYSTKECSRLHFFILFGTLRVLLDNIWPDR